MKHLKDSQGKFPNSPLFKRKKLTLLRVISWSILAPLVFCLLPGMWMNTAEATMTTQEEKKLGEKVFLEVERSVEFVKDPVIQSFLDRVGGSLVPEAGPTPFQFRFYPIKATDPNAFAIPGGYIFVDTGLLILAENETEVAGVLSHEIAHVTSRHVADLMDRAQRINLASLAAMILGAIVGRGGAGSQAAVVTAMAAQNALTLKYTREHEQEADQKALNTMIKAGYDPKGMVTFFNKMHKYSLTVADKAPTYVMTHPALEDRAAVLENLIQTEPKPVVPWRKTSDYKWVRLRAFVDERDPHSAVSHFEAVVRANPEDMEGLVGLGLAYQKTARFDKSTEVLQKAVSLIPDEPSVRRDLGVAYFQSGKIDQATEIFESLVSNPKNETEDPGYLMNSYYLARTYQEKGDLSKALPLLVKVEKAMPDFMDVNFQLGSAYGRMGEKGKSHFYFGRYFKLKGERANAQLHFSTALQYLEKGSPESEQAQREMRELSPSKEPGEGAPGGKKNGG